MAVKPASTWGTKWSTGVQNGGNAWASGYIAAGDAVFTAAADAGPNWQAQVNTAQALANFQSALRNTHMSSVAPTVNGAGKAKFTAAATTKNLNYNTFATEFAPVLQTIVSGLPPRGPKGSAVNMQRMTDMFNALVSKHGQFKQ